MIYKIYKIYKMNLRKILQNVVKIYFTSFYSPLIVWEFLVNKKFLENIRVLVKPKVISCFQKKIENRRKNELTLKLV